MENKTLINNSLLNDNDKTLLFEMTMNNLYPKNIFNLSIFSKLGKEFKIGEYTYDKYNNNCYYHKNMNMWMDCEFKLLPYSNWWCNTDLKRFIQHVNVYLNIIKNINTNVPTSIEGNYMSITKWFVTYGHFLDELFCLKEFQMNEEFKNFIPFTSFELNNKNMYNNTNYINYVNILFNEFYDATYDLTKVNNLIIIRHLYSDCTFHSFPISVSNLIVNKLELKTENKCDEVLFITRGEDPPHLQRNLKNKKEIENFLSNKNVCIFNPEQNNVYDLIKIIKKYNNIIITWGSALTNLCFCNENSNITILKSESYKSENISLFNKIINTHKLKINIIESLNNIIELKDIENIFII